MTRSMDWDPTAEINRILMLDLETGDVLRARHEESYGFAANLRCVFVAYIDGVDDIRLLPDHQPFCRIEIDEIAYALTHEDLFAFDRTRSFHRSYGPADPHKESCIRTFVDSRHVIGWDVGPFTC